MAPVGPWAQPKATRREGGRRAERPVGSYATPDTPCSRTAPEGSLPTERGQTVPALRPELDDPNLFGSSNRSATAGRSPRPREAEGRLAPEMAESHEARSQAQAQRRAWPQCIATWAVFVVAVPLAFFGTFFRFERKYCPPSGQQPHLSRRSRRVRPRRGNGYAPTGAPKGFPLVLWKPSGTEVGEKPMGRQVPIRAVVGASCSIQGKGCAPVGTPKSFPLFCAKNTGRFPHRCNSFNFFLTPSA